MAAPSGVNEGASQEPAEAGSAQVQPVGVVPPEVVPANAVPPPAQPAEGGLADAGPRDAKADPAEAGSVDAKADLAEAGPRDAKQDLAEAGPADAKQELAETGPADAEADLAEAGPGEAEADPAEAGPREAGPDTAGAAEQEPGGQIPGASEESRKVSRLAVAGVILGILVLVAAAAGVLAVITHGFRPKTVVTYRPAAVYGLRPGQCVNTAPNGLSVAVVSCATPHDAEVFAKFSLSASAWPGAAAVQQAAADGCAGRLSGYLNPAFAGVGLTEEYVYPDQTAWIAGERTVVCEVRGTNGPLTGSVGRGLIPAGQ